VRRSVLAALLALVAAGCTGPVEHLTEVLTPSPSASASPSGERVTRIVGDGVAVETPFAGGEVGSPVSVTGSADVLGAQVAVRVLDDAGNELASTVVEASCGDGCVGTFATELFFFVKKRQPGWVEVSGASAEAPAPVVTVPVILAP